MNKAHVTIAVVFLIAVVNLSVAQSTSPGAVPSVPLVGRPPTVVEGNASSVTTPEIGLDQPVHVVVAGLKDWMKTSGRAPKDLRLYLAGHELTGAAPSLVSVEDEYLDFHLDMDASDRDAWVQILYEARQAKDRKIPISVGLADTVQAFDSSVEVKFKVYPAYTGLLVGLLAILLAAVLVLSHKTDLLRSGTTPPPAPGRLPFNLGRVQMAFWFYLVIDAYIYVWMITGEYNTLTNSVLALIGISTGTGLAAVLVDKEKVQTASDQRVKLQTQELSLTARIAQLNAVSPLPGSQLDQELQQKSNSLLETQAALANLPPQPPPAVSAGFVKDILSSGDGVGFHRFQMVVWTLILGIIFVRSVYRELTMPNFDATLLGLMGLSSGTYIGFKFPETPK